MLNSDILIIFAAFSREDLLSFEDFISSPYFNKKPTPVKLFKEIKKYYPDFKSDNLAKEKLFTKIFPGKAYNDGMFRNRMSELNKLLIKFIGVEKILQEDIRFKTEVTKALVNKGLHDLYLNYLKNLKKDFDKIKEVDEEGYYFEKAHILELEADNISYTDNQKSQFKIDSDIGNNFLFYFLVKYFKIMANITVLEYSLNIKFDKSLFNDLANIIDFEKLFERIKEVSNKDYIIISVYYNMFKAVRAKNDHAAFYEFYKLFDKNFHLFSDSAKYNLYTYAANIANKNQLSTKEMLDIYKSMLRRKIYKLYDKGFLPLAFFALTLHSSINENELVWTEKFVEKYIDDLSPEYKITMYNYSKAHLCFATGKFDDSLNYIKRSDPAHYNFKNTIYRLIVKNHYELNEYEGFLCAIDNFKHFIKSSESTSAHVKKADDNFMKNVKKLMDIKLGKTRYDLNEVVFDNPTERMWLELKKRELEYSKESKKKKFVA